MNSNFLEHNLFMYELAEVLFNNSLPLKENVLPNQNVIKVGYQFLPGFKTIVCLYLLLPYLNTPDNQLKYNDLTQQVSIYNDGDVAFSINGIPVTIKNLRDTICHSFVSCDLGPSGDKPVLFFDNRIIMSRLDHDNTYNTKDALGCVTVDESIVLNFIKDSINKIKQVYAQKKV